MIDVLPSKFAARYEPEQDLTASYCVSNFVAPLSDLAVVRLRSVELFPFYSDFVDNFNI
jgi:hypothetical protein